jgi:hypothetical protein
MDTPEQKRIRGRFGCIAAGRAATRESDPIAWMHPA